MNNTSLLLKEKYYNIFLLHRAVAILQREVRRVEQVNSLQYAKNETEYDELDRRRLECLLIEHYHQAEALVGRFRSEITDIEGVEWRVVLDEFEYFNYQITIHRLYYVSLQEQLWLVVEQKNQLVREGFWLSRANVAYRERIRQLDTQLATARRVMQPLGFAVNV